MFTKNNLVFPVPRKNNKGYLKSVLYNKTSILEKLRQETDPITTATEDYISMVKTGALPARIEGMAQILQHIEGLSHEQKIDYIKTASTYYDSAEDQEDGMGETLFIYNDGVTEKVDVVGSLSKESYTSPFGKKLVGLIIGKHVSEIANNAFRNCESLQSVVIPNSVTGLGHRAFLGCKSLKSIIIPTSVTGIGQLAFADCDAMTSAFIPNSITAMGYNLFAHCKSLSSVTLQDGLECIGYGAFSICASLTSISIPDSVTKIETTAFCGSALKSIHISSHVEAIDARALSFCENLGFIDVAPDNPNYKDIDGVLFSKDGKTLIQCPSKRFSHYTVPEGTTEIGEYAFQNNLLIQSIVGLSSVTTIGRQAFFGCSSLAEVTGFSNVTVVQRDAFYSCTSLTSIQFPKCLRKIEKGAFRDCTNIQNLIIPDTVSIIGMEAFLGISHIEYHGKAVGAPWRADTIN